MLRKEVVLALLGLILIGGGVFWWKSGGVEQDKIEIVTDLPAGRQGNQVTKITVDVGGAVEKPGVYEVEIGARIGEVLGLAGGLSGDADTEWVEMYLNRAEAVKDGMKIFVPSKSQETNPNDQTTSNNQITSSKININKASQAKLEELPGIGPVTAKKIIDGRPYGRSEELQERKIVGQKVWEQIKESVSVW